jgi:hypothetical protein
MARISVESDITRFARSVFSFACAVAIFTAAGACKDEEDRSQFKPVNSAGALQPPSGPATTQPRPMTGATERPVESPPPLSPEQAQRGELPPGHPPIGQSEPKPAGPPGEAQPHAAPGGEVRLDGLIATIPQGWEPQTPGMSAFPPKLQYGLPKAEGDPEDAVVKLFHFPNMKGDEMDSANLKRWIGQFDLPQGTPEPPISESTRDGIKFKRLDVTGTFKGGGPMMGGGAAQVNYRMIAVIVDHPAGPHHVKVTGPKATVEKWKASIDKFLDSIRPAS